MSDSNIQMRYSYRTNHRSLTLNWEGALTAVRLTLTDSRRPAHCLQWARPLSFTESHHSSGVRSTLDEKHLMRVRARTQARGKLRALTGVRMTLIALRHPFSGRFPSRSGNFRTTPILCSISGPDHALVSNAVFSTKAEKRRKAVIRFYASVRILCAGVGVASG